MLNVQSGHTCNHKTNTHGHGTSGSTVLRNDCTSCVYDKVLVQLGEQGQEHSDLTDGAHTEGGGYEV